MKARVQAETCPGHARHRPRRAPPAFTRVAERELVASRPASPRRGAQDVEAATRFALRSVARRYRHSPKRSRRWIATRAASAQAAAGLVSLPGSARTTPPPCSSSPETTPRGSGARPPRQPLRRLARGSVSGEVVRHRLNRGGDRRPTGHSTWSAW